MASMTMSSAIAGVKVTVGARAPAKRVSVVTQAAFANPYAGARPDPVTRSTHARALCALRRGGGARVVGCSDPES